MWSLAPNFFEADEFFQILNNASMSQFQKIEAIYSAPDSAGANALAIADDRHWYPWLVPNNILRLSDDPEWNDDDLGPDEGWDH
jgi:hypothetical protein